MAKRIDYSRLSVMKARARDQRARRGTPATHPYVVGRWLYTEGVDQVKLYAIETNRHDMAPSDPPRLVPNVSRWYRWRTRQAAHQWLADRPPLAELRVQNLDSLDTTTAV